MDEKGSDSEEKTAAQAPVVERYSCSRCKFHTTSKRQLQHHIRQRHSPGKYVCQECGEKFNRALMYKLHISTHTNKGDHACPTCNKTFPLVSMLKIHQETHSTESIHPCPHCSKQFRQKSALTKHVAFGHTKKDVHPCTICDKIFPSPSTLLLHMDAHKTSAEKTGINDSAILSRRLRFYQRPTDTNMYKCQRCQRKFFTSYALAKHMEGHHGMTSHKCVQCNTTFKTKKALIKHSAEHVHECDECGKKFRSEDQLEGHKKFHNKGSELQCKQCGRHFSKGTSYKRHMKEHDHNPKYNCPDCGKNFRRQADLSTHQFLHKGDGFACKECGKPLGTKQHLIWHSYLHYSDKQTIKAEEGAVKQESDSMTDTQAEGEAKSKSVSDLKTEPASTSESGTLKKTSVSETALPKKPASTETPKKQTAPETSTAKKGSADGATPKKQCSSDSAMPKKSASSDTATPKKKGSSDSKTPKKEAKKDKSKSGCKKEDREDKEKDKEKDRDKKKEKRRTPSPSKKSDSGASSKSESPKKKSKEIKVERDIHIKQEKIEGAKSKSATSTPSKSAKKSRKRKSKVRRKSKKSSSNDSGEPTQTDTDSKGITENESATDTQSERVQSDKVLSTEEALLSDDVLQDSNELHDVKELRVDTVMFDDIEDDVELDINAAIETLTKLGSHTEHEVVTTEAFDEVIDEELEQQTVDKNMPEGDIVGLEDIGNIETADKEISHVDIQQLYDMETDNDTGADTEPDNTKAVATGVFCAMQTDDDQQQAQGDLQQVVTEDGQVISDTSAAAMLIESEIVTQADRLIQTGLYVQNVMGTQDCNTVLAALDSAVQDQVLSVVPQEMMGEVSKSDLTSSELAPATLMVAAADPNLTTVLPPGTGSQTNEVLAVTASTSNDISGGLIIVQPSTSTAVLAVDTNTSSGLVQDATTSEATVPLDESQITQNEGLDESVAIDTVQQSHKIPEKKSEFSENEPDKKENIQVAETDQSEKPKDTSSTLAPPLKESTHETSEDSSKQVATTEVREKCASPKKVLEKMEENSDGKRDEAKCISGSYVASVETVNVTNTDDVVVQVDTSKKTAVVTDMTPATDNECAHTDRTQTLDGHGKCATGCTKCSTEFGLSINKTVCPHSKELKIVVEKLDFKGSPATTAATSNDSVVVQSPAKMAPPEIVPTPKRKRTASTELESLLADSPAVSPEKVPNKLLSGSSRLRRRIRHSSGGSRSVSTKSCETAARKESQIANAREEVSSLEQGNLRVSTRSSNARGAGRPARTGVPLKEWRKTTPPLEKKHNKKFISVPRRKSDSDQMSPPPQYKVSTLNDLTIRITTQSSPETSPPQQKKSPSYKDGSLKSLKAQEKEDGLLRHAHGATQELCVVLDDINELVLLQQERLQKLKGFRTVKLGKRGEEQKRRHKSGDLTASTIDGPQKPIKIFLRLPKDRIKKHEKSLSLLDKQMKYAASEGGANEYQQPDSSQDMQREKSRLKGVNSSGGGHHHRSKAHHRVYDTTLSNDKDNTSSGMGSPDELASEDWAEEGSPTTGHRVIGSVVSLNNSVLSVEECDSTSMAETQRQASSASSSPSDGATRRKHGGAKRKDTSMHKDTHPHPVAEPLDLTVRYNNLLDADVKPDPDEPSEDPMDADTDIDDEYCTCDDTVGTDEASCNGAPGHHTDNSSAQQQQHHHQRPTIKVEETETVAPAGAGTSATFMDNSCYENNHTDGYSDLEVQPPVDMNGVNNAQSDTESPQALAMGEDGADGPLTEFIEVVDRGIQCELGDELLFMPDAPPQAVD